MWTRRTFLTACGAAAVGCSGGGGASRRSGEVVVFTALDRVYSEPILRGFERETGIAVKPVYDAESAKTTGLVNRLIARRDKPECDVLWNNECVQTESLGTMGLLEPYESPAAARIPAEFRDPSGRWAGFAGRVRVVVYHRDLVSGDAVPRGLGDFTDPARREQGAVALPFYGTTFTHVSFLYQRWGETRLEAWLKELKTNGVAIAPGNGAVRDLVASGERAFGLTDTDDAHGAVLDGKPVGVVIPDAGGGVLLIPNTVSLVSGCPHPDEGRLLIDHLLSSGVERRLALGRSAQVPLGTDLMGVKTPWKSLWGDTRFAEFDIRAAAGDRERVVALLRRTEMDR